MSEGPKYAFKVSSRMPILLGNELIPNASYAVFELVKNGHDADATTVLVDLYDADDIKNGKIVIDDDGCGMDEETIVNSWLVLGTPNRRTQNKNHQFTAKYNRKVVGEKGIGRFAAHKLGSRIVVTTRVIDRPEYVITINWNDFDDGENVKFLEQIPVSVTQREPEIYKKENHGTRIEISELHDTWARGMVRRLNRDINSICSPFDAPGNFQAILDIHPQKDWLSGMFSYEDAEKMALFDARCSIREEAITYDYNFNVPKSLEEKIEKRSCHQEYELSIRQDDTKPKDPYQLSKNDFKHFCKLGEIQFRLLMYDLDNYFVKATMSDFSGVRKFLTENGGIRVYRGGIRVFGLGGSGEDWLDLGGRRVQLPAKRLSNNLVIGAVTLDPKFSSELTEQTNRRGFVENDAFLALKKALIQVISHIEAERLKDKERMKSILSGKRVKMPVLDELLQLREAVKKIGKEEADQLEPAVQRVEKAYQETRDMLLTAASSGLSLGGVVHDVEKQVKSLKAAVNNEPVDLDQIRKMIDYLSTMMEGLTYLLKKNPPRKESIKNLVDHSIFNIKHRLEHHGVIIENGFDTSPDFSIQCKRLFVVNSAMNIIANSIWWMNQKGHTDKRIWIGPSLDLGPGPALVIADNGPGFSDDPDDLVKPFFTRKPEGMGLGLFLADQSMVLQEGQLTFPEPADVGLPEEFNGAVVALLFKKEDL